MVGLKMLVVVNGIAVWFSFCRRSRSCPRKDKLEEHKTEPLRVAATLEGGRRVVSDRFVVAASTDGRLSKLSFKPAD